MPHLLRVRSEGPQWPYSFDQLRRDEPKLSISDAPHAGEIASWLALDPPIVIIIPEPTEPPSGDGYLAVEVRPVCTDGVWHQAWGMVPVPPAPIWPDWAGFAVALIFDDAIQAWFNGLPQAIGSGLNAGLQRASEGRPELFLALWERLAPSIPVEVLAALHDTAEACNLPEDFTAALAPSATEQQE